VVFWAKTIRDEFRPPAVAEEPDIVLPAGAYPPAAAAGAARAAAAPGGAAATEEDAELAAYNAYLARLHKEVKGHGRWHGLR
jgi:hypothetical protein